MSIISRYEAALHLPGPPDADAAPEPVVADQASAANQAADPAAVDNFIRQHYPPLLQFLSRRTPAREDAEDAAQESLARFLGATDGWPREAWKPLLYRIAINVLHDRARRARSHGTGQHVSCDDVELESGQPSPLDQVAHEQQRTALREAVLALPPRCRQVFLLKRLRGMTNAAIARHCGISVKMVERHSTRALVLLRQRLGFAPPDAY